MTVTLRTLAREFPALAMLGLVGVVIGVAIVADALLCPPRAAKRRRRDEGRGRD